MAGICTATASPDNCSHRTVTVTLDGAPIVLHMHESEVTTPLTADEKAQLVRLAIRRGGVALANLLNRVAVGDEATNVKMYPFFGPGAAITKTNIGTNYVNICLGANGERQAIDFTGCTEFRLMMHANLVGTGQWGARVVRDSDNTVLFEQANLGAAGERELDSDWQPLPAAFQGVGLVFMRAQAKSTTGADDPVFRSLRVGLR
jgi:hypothetical protein